MVQANGAENFAALYYYQNMAPNLEKNICGYFKTWIPLAGMNFVNETTKLNAINKIKNLHIGNIRYSHKDKTGQRYFTIEYNNPLSSEYVGIKGFNGSCVIIRRDRFASSPYDNVSNGYVTTLTSTDKTMGKLITHRFYTDELNTLFYCRVFYLDSQAGMIYEDPSTNADKSCVASGLFLPAPISDISLTFKIYQLPKGEQWLVNDKLNTKVAELIPSDSFDLTRMGNNKEWLGDYQFGAELKVNMKVPSGIVNRVKNIAWGALQGHHQTINNAFVEDSDQSSNNAQLNSLTPWRNFFYCNTLLEYRNFGYNNFGWGIMGHTTKTAIGKTENIITLNTWKRNLFWSTYSAVEEDKTNGEIKQHQVVETVTAERWNPLTKVNWRHYGTIYPMITNPNIEYIAFKIDDATAINDVKPRKPACWPGYITNIEKDNVIYKLDGDLYITEDTKISCMFVGWYIILRKSDQKQYEKILKTDGSKIKVKYFDKHQLDGGTQLGYYAYIKYDGIHWNNYVIAQNAVSFTAYYDEHARAHFKIINRGTEDYISKTAENEIVSTPNKWSIITSTLKTKWPNGNNLSTPISGVYANGVTLPNVGEYLKISSTKYDSSLNNQSSWYCKNTKVIQNEKVTKYKYDTKAKKWITDGTISSCDYGNLNKEVRWVVAGYNTFKHQIKKPHMVLISDRPIILPVSAYFAYPGTSFLLKRGKWRETGCSKYLNYEFLNAFDDGEFKSHLESVSLDTGKCCHIWVNGLKTTTDNKRSKIVPNDYDVMNQSNNEKVKIFIPSRRNIWSSITNVDQTRKYYTGEVGPEDTEHAKTDGTQITYTTEKGVKFTCNGDPCIPIFNVSPSGSLLFADASSSNEGYGFLNKNWYMLENSKPRGQKGFFLRGSNGANCTYFVDFDGAVRAKSTEYKTYARSFWGIDGLNHGIRFISRWRDAKAWAALNEFNIVYVYSAIFDGWAKDPKHQDNAKITGPAKGLEYAAYWYNMHRFGTYWNRTWILRRYNDTTHNMIISLNQLKKLFGIFGPVFMSAGGDLNKNLLSDPYRNSMSVHYFEQAADDLAARWKAYSQAKSNNKNYGGVNIIWKKKEKIINSTYGNAPFNHNNDACKNNKYPIGRRIGILPICIIS